MIAAPRPVAPAATVAASSLCACPTGFTCGDIGAGAWPNDLAGSYCVRDGS